MNMKLLLLLLLLLAPSGKLLVQEIPACWCVSKLNEIIIGDTTLYGEWALDTCDIGIEGNCKDLLRGMLTDPSSTVNYYDRLYSTSRFEISIDTIIISRSSTTLTSFNWEDIDDDFIEIKQGLEGLENNYGAYSLNPLSSWENDSLGNRQIFGLEFENFVNIEEVLSFLYHINDSLSGDLYLHSNYDWLYEINYLDENGHQEDINIIINPNPVTDQLNINFDWDLSGNIELKIFDIQGNEIKSNTISCHFGNNIIDLDCANYPIGTYYLQILFKNKKIAEEIIIKK